MINWLTLISNSLWVIALSLLLAWIGISRWESQESRTPVRAILACPSTYLILSLFGILFCAGLAINAIRVWERMLWLVMMAYFVVHFGTKVSNWNR